MENKIWIFGDSFSTPYDSQAIGPWAKTYIEWKGYAPKTFGDLLSDELGLEAIHLAKGGASNDSIFESVYTNVHRITKGDIVIIGWSSIPRFRLASLKNTWWDIVPNHNNLKGDVPPISQRTIDEILVNRDTLLFKEELENRKKFVKWLLRDGITLIQWSPFKRVCLYDIPIEGKDSPTTILEETNGLLNDYHYSEQGHIELSKGILNLIRNGNLLDKFSLIDKPLL